MNIIQFLYIIILYVIFFVYKFLYVYNYILRVGVLSIYTILLQYYCNIVGILLWSYLLTTYPYSTETCNTAEMLQYCRLRYNIAATTGIRY